MTRLRILLLVVCVSLLPTAAGAEEHFISVGPWGTLGIDFPDGWASEFQGPEAGGATAFYVRPSRDIPLVLLLSSFPVAGDPEQVAQSLRQKIGEGLQHVREAAVEKELPTRLLEGPGYRFAYISATDSTVNVPTEDDFKFMDQGMGVVGGLMVTFTLLTNVADAPERVEALESLRSARHLPPAPPWRTATGTVRLWYPGKEWHFTLDLPGFEIPPLQLSEQANAVRLEGRNPASGMRFTLFLEEARKGWGAADYRKYYWKTISKDLPIRREDVRRHERGPIALLEFLIPESGEVPLNQKSVNAFLVHDGVWIDLHLSKDSFEPGEEKFFDEVVDSVRFEDGPPLGE